MLIRTPSLAYDDRVRKEAHALDNMNVHISAFENSKLSLGETYDGIHVYRHSLASRKLFGSKRLVWVKVVEMYVIFMYDYLRLKPKYVWLHNIESLFVIFLVKLFSIITRNDVVIIFDQHELPPTTFIKNRVLRAIYKAALRLADVNVVA